MNQTQKQIVKATVGNVISALLFIALGAVLVAFPGTAVESVAKLIGYGLIISGVVNGILFLALRERGAGLLIHALASLIFGILVVAKPTFFANFFPILMGAYILIRGLGDFGHVFVLKRNGSKKWKAALVITLLIVVLGLLIVLHPAFIEKIIVVATGIAMIVSGLADMIMFARTRA